MANNIEHDLVLPVSTVNKLAAIFFADVNKKGRNVDDIRSGLFIAERLKQRAETTESGYVHISDEEAVTILRELYARLSDAGKLKKVTELLMTRG